MGNDTLDNDFSLPTKELTPDLISSLNSSPALISEASLEQRNFSIDYVRPTIDISAMSDGFSKSVARLMG